MTTKIDLKRDIPTYSAQLRRFDLVTVPPLKYLMINGHGDPNTAASYRDAIATIFPVAYALKFLSKRTLERDYTVMPLEALWSADDMDAFTTTRDKSQWDWTVPPVSTLSGSKRSTRGSACRPSTSGRTTTRRQYSRGCTTRSSRRTA